MHHTRTMLRLPALIALVFSLLLCSAGAQTVAATETQLVDDVPEYQGDLGPDSIFYGLKLSLENLDEAFTSDETERMEKMMVHAELRISETKTMLKYREFTSADRAMGAYQEKLNQASGELDRPGVDEEDLVPVQKTMFKYHAIIQDLQSAYPDRAAFGQILEGSTAVQDRFTEKTQVKIQLKNAGASEMVTVRVQEKEKNKPKGENDETVTGEPVLESTETPDDQQPGKGLGRDKDTEKNKPKGTNGSITETPTATPSPTGTETAETTIVQSTETPEDQKPGKGRDKDKDADTDGNGEGSDNSGKEK